MPEPHQFLDPTHGPAVRLFESVIQRLPKQDSSQELELSGLDVLGRIQSVVKSLSH